jgi:hypothetical protein
MLPTTEQSPQPPAAASSSLPGLNARMLALASVASVLGGVVASAFGGGPVAALACAAISPWITAFLTHPGPHRVRRVTAVLVFAVLVTGCRKAVAVIRAAAHLPIGHWGDVSGAAAQVGIQTISSGQARLAGTWLGQVTLTAATSAVVAVGSLTTVEEIRGHAVAADRNLTFFAGAAPSGPTVHVPGDIVATAGDHAAARVTYRATATDAAGNPLVPACDPPSGALFKLGRTGVACSATDAAGRQGHADFAVTVRRGGAPRRPDDEQPRLSVPDDFTHDATSASGAYVTYVAAADDARDGELTPDCEPASGDLFGLGPTRVVCTATDTAGNTARAAFAITVVRAGDADHTPPEITVPHAIEAPATSKDGATVTYHVSATDNHDGALKPSCDPPSGSTFSRGATTVTCSAQDSSGNKASKRFEVTVVRAGRADLTPPDIKVPRPITVRTRSAAGSTVTYRVSATDDRDGPLKPSCDPRSGSRFTVGKTTVICTAQDAAGNQDTKSFSVTVIRDEPSSDNGSNTASDTPPTIRVPAAIRTPATSKDGAAVTYDVSATDDQDGALKPGCAPPSGSVFDFGTTTVNCVAQDSAGNNAANDFKVTVFDGTPPVITVPPTIDQYAPSAGGPVVYDVSATDDHDGTVTPTCDPPSGSTFPTGPTTVSCSAQDAAGNRATKSFLVVLTAS